MCYECGQEPICHRRCINYVSNSIHNCVICGENICVGEEYIENNIGEYAHWDCVSYGKDLLSFLGYEINVMEEK